MSELPIIPTDAREGLARNDAYIHMSGYEATDPDVIDIALKTHAVGYSDDMGFVNSEAIGSDGYILPSIDKARGPNVEYHVAVDPINPNNVATMRMVHLTDGQSVEDLPAYQVSKEALTSDGEALLRSVEPEKLKELAALAKSNKRAAVGLFEIMRKSVHESLGKDETWFFSIVSDTYVSLARRLGRDAFTLLGEDVQIEDSRVDHTRVKLRPVAFRPDEFFDSMVNSVTNPNSTEDDLSKQRIASSILFFTDGIEDDRLSEEVAQWRERTLSSLGALAIG